MAIANIKNVTASVPRYIRRLVFAHFVGFIVGWLLLQINFDLGLFAVLMLLNIGIVVVAGVISSVQSIRSKEPWRGLGYVYLLLVVAGAIWVIVDM